MEESWKNSQHCKHFGKTESSRQVSQRRETEVIKQFVFRSCSDPEVDRDSDDVECNDDEADLDEECLTEDCFLHYDKQDSKSIC